MLQYWSEVADIKFQRVRGDDDVDIKIYFLKNRIPITSLGRAWPPPDSSIIINDDFTWGTEADGDMGKSSFLTDS